MPSSQTTADPRGLFARLPSDDHDNSTSPAQPLHPEAMAAPETTTGTARRRGTVPFTTIFTPWKTNEDPDSPCAGRGRRFVEFMVPPIFVVCLISLVFILLSLDLGVGTVQKGFDTSPTHQGSNGDPGSSGRERDRDSPFSYDLHLASQPDWMKKVPDEASLSALSIPGTHDTMTHTLAEGHPHLQCQNANLSTQLLAGVRYVDVRARLNSSWTGEEWEKRKKAKSLAAAQRRNQDLHGKDGQDNNNDGDSGEDNDFMVVAEEGNGDDNGMAESPGNLLIYHADAWTGYSFTDVMLTIFEFLDTYPSETIIMRLQREGPPVHVDGEGKPLSMNGKRDNDIGPAPEAITDDDLQSITNLERRSITSTDMTAQERLLCRSGGSGNGGVRARGNSHTKAPLFEAAFTHYMTRDKDTAAGFDRHFYNFPPSVEEVLPSGQHHDYRDSKGDDNEIENREDDDGNPDDDGKFVPTLGAARGNVLLLQDFDGGDGHRNVYGLPWDERDPRLRIEDLWIMSGARDIELKWEAVEGAIREAGATGTGAAATEAEAMDAQAQREEGEEGPLFLSHLSASVALEPREVAAGTTDPVDGVWYRGINDRVGEMVEGMNQRGEGGKTGVLMGDFMGRRLVEGVVGRNWVVFGV